MSTAKKAVVLAAGLGTRLRPLTCAVPKPLMPVWGEPMLARMVALLRERGVEEIVVNCHYLHEQVEAWCKANNCRVSYEPEILGTGGVLNPLREWLGKDAFYLVNGDIVIENVPELALPTGEEIGVALVTEEGPRTIEIEPESKYVTNWKSDEPGWDETYTYAGFAVLSPKILDYVAPTGFSSIVAAFEKAMMDGHFVKAVKAPAMLWTDAGTIANYIELNRTIDEQNHEENAFAALPQLSAANLGDGPIEFLGARGSDRVFFRAADKVAIIYDDSKRGENARYVGHAKWLKAQGIPVPEIIADLPAQKTMVMEWAGAEKKMSLEDYVHVIEALYRFNSLDATALELEPAFDAALWQWECDLFAEHCLSSRYHLEMSAAVSKELEQVAAVLEKEPKALVHRDFQSTNVLWKNGEFRFIDFQGMRLGPAAYDVASLVYDPYVEFTEGERRGLIALYAKRVGREDFPKVVAYAAVQRLCQCLGAYGRLASVGQQHFSKYVLPALQNLLSVADKVDLDAIVALAEELIAKESAAHHHAHEHHCACGHHHH